MGTERQDKMFPCHLEKRNLSLSLSMTQTPFQKLFLVKGSKTPSASKSAQVGLSPTIFEFTPGCCFLSKGQIKHSHSCSWEAFKPDQGRASDSDKMKAGLWEVPRLRLAAQNLGTGHQNSHFFCD